MLTIFGQGSRYCDGISRRSFLKLGALGVGAGGFMLSDLYRAEARAGHGSAPKSVINIFLGGGPSHQDLWDIKTEAPAEIRGEFKPIPTQVTGLQICEVFPKVAAMMDKFVAVRSVVGATGGHDALQCTSGWPRKSLASVGGRPSIGAALAKLQGPVDPSVPPFVGLAAPTKHMPWSDEGQPGFVGPAYAAFKPDGPGLRNLTLNGITVERLSDQGRSAGSRALRGRQAVPLPI
jgi:hypothetical protein